CPPNHQPPHRARPAPASPNPSPRSGHNAHTAIPRILDKASAASPQKPLPYIANTPALLLLAFRNCSSGVRLPLAAYGSLLSRYATKTRDLAYRCSRFSAMMSLPFFKLTETYLPRERFVSFRPLFVGGLAFFLAGTILLALTSYHGPLIVLRCFG